MNIFSLKNEKIIMTDLILIIIKLVNLLVYKDVLGNINHG